MKINRVPPLALAALLQIAPICRIACINPAVAPTGFAIVFRWFAGAGILLGGIDAVSGASAAIAGLANLSPPGPVTTNAVGTVGQLFAYRIVVTNPGSDHQGDYWNAWPLPPGLTINTNIGGNGRITGTPTAAGVYYPVHLMAGHVSFPTPVYKDVMITIQGVGGSPPTITGPPTNQTVQEGANVSFTVTATGDSSLSYFWQFAGTNIAGATNATLQLNNVQLSSSGTYIVTVTNPAGSTSASATLTVNATVTPPTITTQPQSLTVTNGGNAMFSVVASGTAPLSYQWLRNGSNLTGATSATLNLTGVTTNNSGDYTVVVSNSAGSVPSSVATLTVLVPPAITTQPQNLTVTNGGSATFSVVASGTPPLNYQWKHDGATVAGATSAVLNITGVKSADSGDYVVEVSNAAGTATSTAARLTVQTPLALDLKLASFLWINGRPAFDITGPVNTNYVIWSSTNLAAWTALQTNFTADGTWHFSDTNSPIGNARFYRATLGQ